MPLNLTANSHTLELVTTTTTTTNIALSGRDNTSFGQTPVAQETAVSSGTTTTIAAAPSSGTQRQVDDIEILVTGSGSQGIKVQKNNGSNTFAMINVVLNTNERVAYTNDQGFRVFDSLGREKFLMGFSQMAPSTLLSVGSYTPPVGCTALLVEVWGAAGGSAGAPTAASAASLGGGGACGGYAAKLFIGVPSSITPTYGTGGTAGANTGATAGTGGDTTVTINSVTVTGKGGLGGTGMAAAAITVLIAPGGAAPPTGTGGDVNGFGEPGGDGIRLSGTIGKSGNGGTPIGGVGAGGQGLIVAGVGVAGTGFASGAAGGSVINGSAAVLGAAGKGGCVIFTPFSG